MDIFRTAYFGLVFDLVYQTCKDSCTYVFWMESLLSSAILTYDHISPVH